jgi:LPXTG-site transpeptidase (sortase) family protein
VFSGRVPAIIALLFLLTSSFGFITPSAHAAAPTEFYVEATGHTLGGEFLQYWIRNNGRETLGNPVSEPIPLPDGQIQYFQYGVLAQLPDGTVAREMAALALRQLQQHPGQVIGRELEDVPTSAVLSEITPLRASTALGSGHPYPVAAGIQAFYHTLGGLTTFGRALAPAESTRGASTQWFEFVRVDVSPAGPALAEVGLELAEARAIDTARLPRGDLPAFDPNRYTDFFGDGTIPEADTPFAPTRILIPAIDVDATIEPVGVVGGQMQVPVDEWNVGWYPSMASPGEWSNVVMAAHKDWWGVGPVVFWNLDKLAPGDRIYVVGPTGAGATYEVTESWQVDSTVPADPLIADTGYEALTLITCDGQWTGAEYNLRRIVLAKRI